MRRRDTMEIKNLDARITVKVLKQKRRIKPVFFVWSE